MTANNKHPEGNRPRKVFRFIYHPYADTLDGKLIAYLQKRDGERSTKEMVLQALRMCWLPLAYKAQTGHRIGLISCHALEQHLAYLRMELGLATKSADDVLPIPLSVMTNPQVLAAMLDLDVSDLSKNNNKSKKKIKRDSDSFISGEGSFYDDVDDSFINE
jgi:hypothetical protein